MAIFSYGLAKGLREPCSPYREAYYFGAPLNEPSADGWNCLPEFVSQTTSFDLSTIPKGREVLVALLNVRDTPAGSLNFKAEWYRNRDNALLFTLPWSYQARAGGWTYFYAYLGYVDWEINENGGYRVEFTVSGALSYFKVIQFTISGIPFEEEEEEEEVGFFPAIVSWLDGVSAFFYSLYLETLGWWALPDFVSDLFYSLSGAFSSLAWNFSDFATAWYDAVDKLKLILNWDTIWDYITERAGQIWEKIQALPDFLIPIVREIPKWYDFFISEAQKLIDVLWDKAKLWIDWLDERLNSFLVVWSDFINITWPQFTTQLSSLLAEWSTFITITLPQLPNWLDIEALIQSWAKSLEPFWAGWQDWRDKVTEFFTDPEDWLYKSVDRIIERYW